MGWSWVDGMDIIGASLREYDTRVAGERRGIAPPSPSGVTGTVHELSAELLEYCIISTSELSTANAVRLVG